VRLRLITLTCIVLLGAFLVEMSIRSKRHLGSYLQWTQMWSNTWQVVPLCGDGLSFVGFDLYNDVAEVGEGVDSL